MLTFDLIYYSRLLLFHKSEEVIVSNLYIIYLSMPQMIFMSITNFEKEGLIQLVRLSLNNLEVLNSI